MKQWLLFVVLMLSFGIYADKPTILLQSEEVNEILNAHEPYAYFGSEAGSLINDLAIIHGTSREKVVANNLDMICSFIAAGRTTAPTHLLKSALEEAIACLQVTEDLSKHDIERLVYNIEQYYSKLESGNVVLTLSNNPANTQDEAKIRVFSNKFFEANLVVAGNSTVKGNELVQGSEVINGNLTVLGSETINGNLTVNGQFISNVSPVFSNSLVLTGNPQQACIIFQDSNMNEKARICSSPTQGLRGIFVSVDGGTTQNVQINNASNVVITPQSSSSSPALTVNSNGNAPAILAIGNGTANAPALQLFGNPSSSVNDSFLEINSSNVITQSQSGYLVTNTINFAHYFPSYAPLTGAMTGTVNFYGDNIMLPEGTVTAGQEWPALVASNFGIAYSNPGTNLALNNNMVNDIVSGITGPEANSVYATRPAGTNGTVFFGAGFNDINFNAAADNIFDEFRHTFEAATLFCCLPDSQKINARNVAQSAGWSNATTSPTNFGSWGVETSTNGASLTATVSGRYVGFATPSSTNNNTSQQFSWDVTIDGTFIGTSNLQHASPNTANGTQNNDALWFFDASFLNNNPTHTIVVSRDAASTGSPSVITYFFGFNPHQANANTVFIVSPILTYYSQLASPANGGTEIRRNTMRQIIKDTTRKFRTEYGLPVYLVDVSYPWLFGMVQSDDMNPNADGHQYIANRVISVINNGEFNYLT